MNVFKIGILLPLGKENNFQNKFEKIYKIIYLKKGEIWNENEYYENIYYKKDWCLLWKEEKMEGSIKEF